MARRPEQVGGVIVVTTFSPKGYEVYGRRMIESFVESWPKEARLHIYYEGEKPADASAQVEWISLDDDADRRAFMAAHKDREDVIGDYRFRIVRYCHKVFAQTAAPREDYLIWLDGDTITTNHVSLEFLNTVLPPADKVASYLARPYHRHTETGFIAYNMKAGGSEFLDELRRLYTSGEIKNLPEWHDCMAFDAARRKFERKGYRFHNLCPGAFGLNVFEQSPLSKFLKHNKGPDRKERAYGDPML